MEIEHKILAGKEMLQTKQFECALKHFYDLCKNPNSPPYAWYGLGIAALRTSKTTLAFRSLRNALNLEEYYPNILKAMKEILYIRKRFLAYDSISKRYNNCFPEIIKNLDNRSNLSLNINCVNKQEYYHIYNGKPIENLTIICHFYNEEYLLPWWISHHTKIAKNGVMINYNSNDDSIAMCKKYAPHWKIINSRNKNFSAKEVDLEVMEIERNISGWKIVLNITEFMHISKFHAEKIFTNLAPCAIPLKGIVMVSDNQKMDFDGNYDEPIITQFRKGMAEVFFSKENKLMIMRSRILHSYETGKYYIGRHNTEHKTCYDDNGPYILWYGYSPWNRRNINRKLQIQSKIPILDRNNMWGSHHINLEAKLMADWANLKRLSMEILTTSGSLILNKIPSTSYSSVNYLKKSNKIFIPASQLSKIFI